MKKTVIKALVFWLIVVVLVIGVIGALGGGDDVEPTEIQKRRVRISY